MVTVSTVVCNPAVMGPYDSRELELFDAQAQLLLSEATQEARSLAEHLASSDGLPLSSDDMLQTAKGLMHLVQQVIEFGIKEEWLQILPPHALAQQREALFVARKMASRSPPSSICMLQALESGWKGASPPGGVLTTAEVTANSAAAHAPSAHSATLKSYLYATFNSRTSGALVASLVFAKDTVLQDWCYAWAPLHRPEAAPLIAALQHLDTLHRGSLLLPLAAPPADATAKGVPVGQRVQGFMAAARNVATGVIQHTSAQASAFTHNLRYHHDRPLQPHAVQLQQPSDHSTVTCRHDYDPLAGGSEVLVGTPVEASVVRSEAACDGVLKRVHGVEAAAGVMSASAAAQEAGVGGSACACLRADVDGPKGRPVSSDENTQRHSNMCADAGMGEAEGGRHGAGGTQVRPPTQSSHAEAPPPGVPHEACLQAAGHSSPTATAVAADAAVAVLATGPPACQAAAACLSSDPSATAASALMNRAVFSSPEAQQPASESLPSEAPTSPPALPPPFPTAFFVAAASQQSSGVAVSDASPQHGTQLQKEGGAGRPAALALETISSPVFTPEPRLPCSSVFGKGPSSMQSVDFSSPRRERLEVPRSASPLSLTRNSPAATPSSRHLSEPLPHDAAASRSLHSSMHGSLHSSWHGGNAFTMSPRRTFGHTSGMSTGGIPDVDICVGEFQVVDHGKWGRHAEFEVTTSVAGLEVATVTRRFRQIRTLQQRLRGRFRGGNMDLFFPLPGEHALPASWTEITRAATAFGAARTSPATLAGRRALLQRCLSDLVEHRPHLLRHAALLEFLGMPRGDGEDGGGSIFGERDSVSTGAASPQPSRWGALGSPAKSPTKASPSWRGVTGHWSGWSATAQGAAVGQSEQHPDCAGDAGGGPSSAAGASGVNSVTEGGTRRMSLESDCGSGVVPAGALSGGVSGCLAGMLGSRLSLHSANSRHLRMRLDEPPDMRLSEAEVARRQDGMCRGCGRTLGCYSNPAQRQAAASEVDTPAASSDAAGGKGSPLQRLNSLRKMLMGVGFGARMERPRRCFYDGGLYCPECHKGQVCEIPSRIVTAWDFRKLPVSSDAYDFLTSTRSQPLLRFDDTMQSRFFMRAPLLRDTTATRRRVAALVTNLGDSTTNVTARDAALRIRHAAGPRRHLVDGHELWSILDLLDLAQGAAFSTLPTWLANMESIASSAATTAFYTDSY